MGAPRLMFIARNPAHHRVLVGPEVEEYSRYYSRNEFYCPICAKRLMYNSTAEYPFDYFSHEDGTPDCTESKSASVGHRLPVEIAVKQIHNRLREVTAEPVDIDVERRIGGNHNFKIADIRVTSPLRIAAEVYNKASYLDLTCRLRRMFSSGYRAYVIFNVDGRHDVAEIEQHIQQLAPLRVGRFNPETMNLSLGDLFSRCRISFDKSARDSLPSYIR